MRHLKGRRKLNRSGSHRVAMLRNMVTALLRHEQITTTDTRAKEIRPIAERVITLAKRVQLEQLTQGSEDEQQKAVAQRVHGFRLARRWVNDREVLQKVFDVYGVRYRDRNGGYTRIIKLGFRPGDNAPMSLIQLVEEEGETSSA